MVVRFFTVLWMFVTLLNDQSSWAPQAAVPELLYRGGTRLCDSGPPAT